MVNSDVIIPLVLAGLGGVVWAVRVEGRINTHEREDKLIHEHVAEKLDDLKQDLKDLKAHFGVKSNGQSH